MLTCPSCGGVNPAEASFCMGCATPLGAATAPETRKIVTALFCDLVGSTTLGERLDPEVLRRYLDRYFAAMREAVERHGGRVEKFIGTRSQRCSGCPSRTRTTRCGRCGRGGDAGAPGSAQHRFADPALPPWIGITTGEVLVPGGGAPLIGDAMNTASRLQSTAEPGSVVIGEPTWRLVRDAVVAEPVEPLALKGKTEPVQAYRVVNVASLSPLRTRRLDAPMVGRKRESDCSSRHTTAPPLTGPASCSRSSAQPEPARAGWSRSSCAHVDGDAETSRGRCLAYGEAITWYPVTEALRGALGLSEFADADVVRSAIHEAVGEEEHAPAIEANLARLFGAGEGGAPEETAWAIRLIPRVRRGSDRSCRFRRHPLGRGSVLRPRRARRRLEPDASILLLCMARPDLVDERPTWGRRRTNATTISRPALGRRVRELIACRARFVGPCPRRSGTGSPHVAEGNPLYRRGDAADAGRRRAARRGGRRRGTPLDGSGQTCRRPRPADDRGPPVGTTGPAHRS